MKSGLTSVLLMTKMFRPFLVAMVLLCSTLGLAQVRSLPLAGGTMHGPIVGDMSFVEPDFGATTGGLHLKDTYENTFYSGQVAGVNYFALVLGSAPGAAIEFSDVKGGQIALYSTNGPGIQINETGVDINGGPGKVTVTNLAVHANNAAALAGGLVAGNLYRTGTDPDVVCVVH